MPRQSTRKMPKLISTIVIIGVVALVFYFTLFTTYSDAPTNESSESISGNNLEILYPAKDDSSNSNIANINIDKENSTANDPYTNSDKELRLDTSTPVTSITLSTFFDELDNKEYVKEILGDEKSKDKFYSIMQKLVDSPPIISGESDDLYNLLQNTAHFFRTLGGDNIKLLKLIIIRESKNIENIAADFYTNIENPTYFDDKIKIPLNTSPFYEYSCFFLNTMGGRLYVFRRNTETRMIINYYSLLIVAKAEENGENNHGIDIRKHLENLIKEIEDYGQKLVFRDIYLKSLYNLEKKFQQLKPSE
ncbi:MAG: hypothetical protein OCC45_11970 [Desulfotalea sp.]